MSPRNFVNLLLLVVIVILVLFVIYEAGFEKGVAISHLVDLIYRIILNWMSTGVWT